MNFNANDTTGLGDVKKVLEGNKIHTVKFNGIEMVEMKNGEMHCLRVKFGNDEGYFSHTIFEPQDGDDKDTDGAFGKNPSRWKETCTFLRHLGAAVCPDLNKLVDTFGTPGMTWMKICKAIVDTTTPAIGTETKIKLLKRKYNDPNTGEPREEAQFPRFFLAYSKEGRLYMRTSFIGKGVYFLNKELDAIKKQDEAKPVAVNEFDTPTMGFADKKSPNMDSFDDIATTTAPKDEFDINI